MAIKKPLKKAEPRVVAEAPRVQTAYRIPDFSGGLDLSCKDWERRIRLGQSLMPTGLLESLDQERMMKAQAHYDFLHLPDVPGTPTMGEVGANWYREIVGAVFGAWNGIERGINEFFILVPKKNSKTTNSAGIMLLATLLSERPRAEFLLVAPTQLVANLSFQQAVGMIEADDDLRKMIQVQEYHKKIIVRHNKCSLQIKSFDPKVLTGTKPAGVLLDELHVIAEHSNADRVLGQIRGGLISQPEGFLITITTQSERVASGVFRTELLKARKVRDGALKLKILPILYEFPEKMVKNEEWRNPENWGMVTPNMGLSITLDRMVESYNGAVADGEEELRRWSSQHLNLEIGLALRTDHWVGGKFWQQTAVPMDLEKLIAESDVVTVGIDGGGLDDMLGFTACGRNKETAVWTTWSKAWLHKIALERRKSEIHNYRDFEKEGDLSIVDALGEDIAELGDLLEQVHKSGKLNLIGVDPSGIGAIIDEIDARGIDTAKQVVGVSQGWRLNGAIKTTERKLADGTLKHATQRLVSWCVENARVEPRGNAILITKQASGTGKIDPLMAAFNAIELMSRNPEGKKDYQIHFLGGNS